MWCRNPSFKSCHSSIGFSRCDDQDRRPAASHANLASRKGAYSSRVNVCRRMLQAGSLFPQPGPERGPKESDKVQTSTYERSDREKEREREREREPSASDNRNSDRASETASVRYCERAASYTTDHAFEWCETSSSVVQLTAWDHGCLDPCQKFEAGKQRGGGLGFRIHIGL